MRNILLVFSLLMAFTLPSQAKMYVVIDKSTGEVQGTADISDDSLLEWTPKNILKDVGEEYRGKQASEIRVKGGKVVLATENEKVDAERERVAKQKLEEKEKLLNILGLNDKDIENIKKLRGE